MKKGLRLMLRYRSFQDDIAIVGRIDLMKKGLRRVSSYQCQNIVLVRWKD